MADKSKIEWTEASWNPIRARVQQSGRVGWHCTHASEGCRNCYAESMNRRLGTGLDYKPGHKRLLDIFLDEKMLTQPLRWRRPRMIFVCSMTDLFADFVSDEWIDRIFAVMALCPQHTFQVLTKRPERMRAYMAPFCQRRADGLGNAVLALGYDGPLESLHWPPPNAWLGTSVEDQETADARIPELLATPAAVRWISAEPLLGPVDLTLIQFRDEYGRHEEWDALDLHLEFDDGTADTTGTTLDWVVVGGESGGNARPLNVTWARDLVSQCLAAGVPAFVKQLGRRPYWDLVNGCGDWPLLTRTTLDGRQIDAITLKDKKGGDWSEWPEDLRVRQFPEARP